MAVKIIIVALCALAAALTFRAEWILKNVFKLPEPSEKAVMTLKLIALLMAILLFITVFRV